MKEYLSLIARGALTITIVLGSLSGCGESPKSDRLQDPILEMGDAFDVDIASLPVLKQQSSGLRVLATPIDVPAPSSERNDPERAAIGVPPAHWRLYATFAEAAAGTKPSNDEIHGAVPVFDSASVNAVPADDRLAIGFPSTGRIYTVDRHVTDFEKLAEFYEAKGTNLPSAPGDESVESTRAPKVFSDNVDNRVPKGIWENGANIWPWRTISMSVVNGTSADSMADGTCSATLIGPPGERYIITAAHCFWDLRTGAHFDLDYIPRKDGCEVVSGWPIPDCDRSPYGKYDGQAWIMPQSFLDHCIGTDDGTIFGQLKYLINFTTCRRGDISVKRVVPEGSPPWPGSMGFGVYSAHQVQNVFTVWHRGYPGCNSTATNTPPVNCRQVTLYGQNSGCNFGMFSGRWVQHSCDASGGHSGAPLYLYDGGGVYVYGVHVGEDSSQPISTPAAATVIDSQFNAWMLDFMNL